MSEVRLSLAYLAVVNEMMLSEPFKAVANA
jgi:hypothetical protein